jgi:hypothetical protein
MKYKEYIFRRSANIAKLAYKMHEITGSSTIRIVYKKNVKINLRAMNLMTEICMNLDLFSKNINPLVSGKRI